MTTSFKINGEEYTVDLPTLPAGITLNTFIREHAQLTATKYMCLEGGCGACIVAVKRKNPLTGNMECFAVNSCLTLLNVCHDWEIVTDEGIGNKRLGYHPIQKRLAAMNGTQCGYCSPGFVMNMYALMESKNDKISMAEVENSFGGNICRCTGYRPILDAFKSFAADSTIATPMECSNDIEDLIDLRNKICPKSGEQCAGKCRKNATPLPINLTFDDGVNWHWPKSLEELFPILAQFAEHEKFMLVAGNTAHGVYRRPHDIKHYVDLNAIPVLKQFSHKNDKLVLGANLSLTEAMDKFKEASTWPGFEYCEALYEHFDLIANVPVRNTGTLAGNISIKKDHIEFPSDVFVTFEALDAAVIVNTAAKTQQKLSLPDYLQSKAEKQVITAFELKAYPKTDYIFKSYKIMPRAQNAHAYVNAAFLLKVEPATDKILTARICFGGIRPDFTHSKLAEEKLTGKIFHDNETIASIFGEMPATFQPDAVLPDAAPEYRTLLGAGLLYKFLLSIAPGDKIKNEYRSGGEVLKRPLSNGTQEFETVEKNYPVTKAVPKIEGLIQCSGEATYMNDTLTTQNTAFCAFVPATKVGATIEAIDPAEALKLPGVLAFYAAKDIPGTNVSVDKSFGGESEELFCASTVKYHNQPLGVIVATTADTAHQAVPLVKVMYSTRAATEIYTSIDDVLAAEQMQRVHSITKKEVNDSDLNDGGDISGSGVFKIGSQYHFTMEPQTTVVVPFEQGLQVWSATQWMDHTQLVIANMLQMKVNDVQLKVPRLGGAYGAKITRGNQVACAAALAAAKLNRPIRFVQTIESMMGSNGKRWACRSDYDFNVKKNGKIVALKNFFYEDAGCSLNENPIGGHSTVCSSNCYDISNYKLEGQAVLTDAPSSTWCRAPGSVEGIAMIENIMEHIAFETKVDPADVRLANIKAGNKMLELLPEFLTNTQYRERRKEIDDYNSKNRWCKRGLGLAVMEYPIFYFGQYSVTVAIYHTDGTVIISHGGIEMGQGMNTKIAQVAAFVLGVPLESVKIVASDTLNGANSMVTGGAIGSEVLCCAVRKACNTLNERLKPIKDSLKQNASWQEVVGAAWARSINMIASDHFKVGDLENYLIYGLALTEVQIDILTGNLLITRVDLYEDTGESLSPYIDIGQVEGAFVMGLGYWLSEQLTYDRQTGELLTNRTWNYKPPGAKDIPIDFRIKLSQKIPNSGGFMRSKATGEPATCLPVSVIFAIQHALQSARTDAGLKREWVRLGAPTTPETVVLNAGSNANAFALK